MDDMYVYLVNLSRYASGMDSGEWFKLPLNSENVAEVLGLNGIESEYAVHDTDGVPIHIDEYTTIEEINRMYELMTELPEYMLSNLNEFVGIYGTLQETVEAFENERIGYYSGITDEVELAYYLIDECGVLGEIPEALSMYINYEAFARDYAINNCLVEVTNGLCVIYRG